MQTYICIHNIRTNGSLITLFQLLLQWFSPSFTFQQLLLRLVLLLYAEAKKIKKFKRIKGKTEQKQNNSTCFTFMLTNFLFDLYTTFSFCVWICVLSIRIVLSTQIKKEKKKRKTCAKKRRMDDLWA